ncbi:MAG: hypothetical protein FWC06_05030, partial [Treponema sp.]|nr:hypothetical protein [Treponema sp.]
ILVKLLTLAILCGFFVLGCGDPTPPPPATLSETYTWYDSSSNIYSLFIEGPESRSISSGSYTLTITDTDGNSKTSTGTFTGSVDQIELTPNGQPENKISISIDSTASTITIDSPIVIIDDGGNSLSINAVNSVTVSFTPTQKGTPPPVLTAFVPQMNEDGLFFSKWNPAYIFSENDYIGFGIKFNSPVNNITKTVFKFKNSAGEVIDTREFTSDLNAGNNLTRFYGSWNTGEIPIGSYTVECSIVDSKGLVSNTLTTAINVTRTGTIQKSIKLNGITLNGMAGIWIVKTLPPENYWPRNTAIMYGDITASELSVDLIIPRDNTWAGNLNSSEPRPDWTGTGDFYVLLVPIIDNSYHLNLGYIYTNGSPKPAEVSFSDGAPEVNLSFSGFKPILAGSFDYADENRTGRYVFGIQGTYKYYQGNPQTLREEGTYKKSGGTVTLSMIKKSIAIGSTTDTWPPKPDQYRTFDETFDFFILNLENIIAGLRSSPNSKDQENADKLESSTNEELKVYLKSEMFADEAYSITIASDGSIAGMTKN